jgi:hypothetical protein
VNGEEFAALVESFLSGMRIHLDDSGQGAVLDVAGVQDPAHRLPDQPETQKHEEEVKVQELTEAELEFA